MSDIEQAKEYRKTRFATRSIPDFNADAMEEGYLAGLRAGREEAAAKVRRRLGVYIAAITEGITNGEIVDAMVKDIVKG